MLPFVSIGVKTGVDDECLVLANAEGYFGIYVTNK
jgi:hypothetical protein